MSRKGSGLVVADLGPSEGVFLEGTLLGYKRRAPFIRANGDEVHPWDVGVQSGKDQYSVGYSSRDEADEATAGSSIGEPVRLQVTARHGVKDGRSWLMWSGGASAGPAWGA